MRARILSVRLVTALLASASTVLASACAHVPPAPAPVTENATTGPETPAHLAPTASYRTLAARVDALAGLPSESDRAAARCVLRAEPGGYELVAELAPAVSPLPPLEPDALRPLRSSETVRLVSRWGTDGAAGPYVGTFTHHPPLVDHFAVVVVVHGERASLRSTVADGPREDDLDRARTTARLEGVRARRPVLVVVADAEVHLDVLARWLPVLDTLELPVALGMVLHTDRELATAPPSSGGTESGRCAALPPLEETGPLGTMTPAALRDALPALRDAVTRCATLVPSRAVASGGRLRLGVRLDAGGRADEACVTDDSVGDDAFRICLVDAARSLNWPTPTTAGYVDVYLPLVLAPDRSAFHRGLCAP